MTKGARARLEQFRHYPWKSRSLTGKAAQGETDQNELLAAVAGLFEHAPPAGVENESSTFVAAVAEEFRDELPSDVVARIDAGDDHSIVQDYERRLQRALARSRNHNEPAAVRLLCALQALGMQSGKAHDRMKPWHERDRQESTDPDKRLFHLGLFVDECCLRASDAKVRVSDLHAAYLEWHQAHKAKPCSGERGKGKEGICDPCGPFDDAKMSEHLCDGAGITSSKGAANKARLYGIALRVPKPS